MIWFDSHCHLNHADFDPDRPEVLARARAAGVRRLLVVGYDRPSSEAALALADGRERFAVIGFHPSEAGKVGEEELAWLAGQLGAPGVVALGEIGVDLHWERDNLKAQVDLFERQLALAREAGRPVVIHEREAYREVYPRLRRAGVQGVLHCFNGDEEAVAASLDLPFAYAVGGTLTYKRNEALRRALRLLPPERLLLETDAPYLTPVPHRGRRNEPAYLPIVGQHAATLLGVPLADLAQRTWENTCRFFGLSAEIPADRGTET